MTFGRKLDRISVHPNLVHFFRDLVCEALRNQNVDADEVAEFYIVNLLAKFQKAEALGLKCPKTGETEPAALTYLRALNGTPQERATLFKSLGDSLLYLSGCFSEHLESTSVGLSYYMSLGGNAYNGLANTLGTCKPDLQDLFQDLAENFSSFADILSEVSETAGLNRDTNLLKLYDRWLKTGSARVEKILVKAGIPLNLSDRFDPENSQ